MGDSIQHAGINDGTMVSINNGTINHISGEMPGVRCNLFLQSLRFDGFEHRLQTLQESPAHLGTYDWIFDDSIDIAKHWQESIERIRHVKGGEHLSPCLEYEHTVWSSQNEHQEASYKQVVALRRWLKEDQNGVFWVYGKPGCGKSTLMASVLRYYTQALSELDPPSLGIASAFFWEADVNRLAKSKEGLLRSLLHQILSHDKSAVDLVLARPESTNVCHAMRSSGWYTWSVRSLQDILKAILTRHGKQWLLIIDALDECENDPIDLAKMIEKMGSLSSVKILAAGRFESKFQKHLRPTGTLAMHDITRIDIAKYVTETFIEDEDAQVTITKYGAKAAHLITDLISQSQGIFLWVVIALNSLIDGCEQRESIKELRSRLQELPEDIRKLYLHIISKISRRDRKKMALRLLVASCHFDLIQADVKLAKLYRDQCRPQLTPSDFFLAEHFDGDDPQWLSSPLQKSEKDLEDDMERVSYQLRTQYAHFFQVRDRELRPGEWDGASSVVEFVHRSVLDTFRDREMTQKLLDFAEIKQKPFIHQAAAATIKEEYIRRSSDAAFYTEHAGISQMFSAKILLPVEAAEAFSGQKMTVLKDGIHEFAKAFDLADFSVLYPDPASRTWNGLHHLRQYKRDHVSLWPFVMCRDVDFVQSKLQSEPGPNLKRERMLLACLAVVPIWTNPTLSTGSGRLLGEILEALILTDDEALTVLHCVLQWLQATSTGAEGALPFSHLWESLFDDINVSGLEFLIKKTVSLNRLPPLLPHRCDRSKRSLLGILLNAKCKLRRIGGPSLNLDALITLSSCQRDARDVRLRYRRWTLPVVCQTKAFSHMDHSCDQRVPAQAFQTAYPDLGLSDHLRPQPRFSDQHGHIITAQHDNLSESWDRGNTLEHARYFKDVYSPRRSSTSRLKGWRDVEDNAICGSEFRRWADLQHVLNERLMFDDDGFRKSGVSFDDFKEMLTGSERLLNLNASKRAWNRVPVFWQREYDYAVTDDEEEDADA